MECPGTTYSGAYSKLEKGEIFFKKNKLLVRDRNGTHKRPRGNKRSILKE
jgi:hypothetical protein